jgi:hypothetical protein
MADAITDDELARLKRLGTVEYDPETHNIARFGELIDKLNELISANAARTQADLARSQVQLEVLASLQKTMRDRTSGPVTKSQAVDLGPLRDVLAEIHQANAERAAQAYQFDIQRVEGGLMTGVTATPITPTKH